MSFIPLCCHGVSYRPMGIFCSYCHLRRLSDKEGVDIIVITLGFSPHRILYDVIGNTYEDGAGDTEVKSNMARSRGVISISAN